MILTGLGSAAVGTSGGGGRGAVTVAAEMVASSGDTGAHGSATNSGATGGALSTAFSSPSSTSGTTGTPGTSGTAANNPFPPVARHERDLVLGGDRADEGMAWSYLAKKGGG